MSQLKTARNIVVTAYVSLYVGTVLWALTTSSGASGGMAFVLPVILGIPWSLLLGVLIHILPIPQSLMIMLLIVVSPVLNVFLILKTNGIFARNDRH